MNMIQQLKVDGYKKYFKVPSKTDRRRKPYKVTLTKKNEWQCSCPHWIFRHGKPGFRPCSHINLVA